eukprot:364425-Chlamydomonas_euryale.AAC.6
MHGRPTAACGTAQTVSTSPPVHADGTTMVRRSSAAYRTAQTVSTSPPVHAGCTCWVRRSSAARRMAQTVSTSPPVHAGRHKHGQTVLRCRRQQKKGLGLDVYSKISVLHLQQEEPAASSTAIPSEICSPRCERCPAAAAAAAAVRAVLQRS